MKELAISHKCIWRNKISSFTYRDASQQRKSSDLPKAFEEESKHSADEERSRASDLKRKKSLSKRKKSSSSSSSSYSSSSSSSSSFSSSSSDSRYLASIGKPSFFHLNSDSSRRYSNLNRSSPTTSTSRFSPPVWFSGLTCLLCAFFHFPCTSASLWVCVAVAVFAYCKKWSLGDIPFSLPDSCLLLYPCFFPTRQDLLALTQLPQI